VTLPNGGQLTVSRWQQLGIDFGMQGGIDRVHQLVFRASNDLSMFNKIAYKTLQQVQARGSFDGNPIYAVLHEPLYCVGHASQWSADRIVKQYPQFSWAHIKSLKNTEPVYFTGEMIFPDMFDDYVNLRPLKGVAEILANDNSWGPLYNLDQLAKNEVAISAATYYEDMYVDFDFAQDTASKVKNVEQYITNQFFHNGIQVDPKDIMKHLFKISKREQE